MVQIGYFVMEMVVIFVSSRLLLRNLSAFVARMTKDRDKTIRFIATLFLPGTTVHELAHYFTASVLGVAVGEIDLVPRLSEGQLKLGSVEVGKMDPVRKLLVSGAPFILGVGIMLLVLYLDSRWTGSIYWDLLVGYIVFQVSNTMFMSKRDMEAVWEFVLLVVIVGVALYLVGFRIMTGDLVGLIEFGDYLKPVNELLLMPIVINLGFLVGVRGLRYL